MAADVDADRAAAAVNGITGARVTVDPFSVIADDEVDAVVVASSDATHADLVIAAVRAGKPVLCEKPLAPTVAECERVVAEENAVTAKTGVPLISLGFMRRYDPGYQQLRREVAGGSVGRPLLVHCISRGVAAAPGATTESSVTGSAIHEFDVLPWLLGSLITEVSWHAPRSTSAAGVELQDPQVLLLRTADGVLSTVEVFLNATYGYDVRCEIVGEVGAVALVEPARTVIHRNRGRSVGYPADWRPRFADAYRAELQAWVNGLGGLTDPDMATAHDGLQAGRVADAVLGSMRSGGAAVAVLGAGPEPRR
jgi:myo-inositol 2-dehydrogenase/D-chiro-inositol 1-dehydrogenase